MRLKLTRDYRFFKRWHADKPQDENYTLIAKNRLCGWLWVANRKAWYFLDEEFSEYLSKDFVYEEIFGDEVNAARKAAKSFDGRNPIVKDFIAECEAHPGRTVCTSAQLGIPVMEGERPLTGEVAQAIIAAAPVGKALTVAIYPPAKRRAAQQLASEIRSGKRSFPGDRHYEVGTEDREDGGVVVTLTPTMITPDRFVLVK